MKAWYIAETDRMRRSRRYEKTATGTLTQENGVTFASPGLKIEIQSAQGVDLVPLSFPIKRLIWAVFALAIIIFLSIFLAFALSPGVEMATTLWLVAGGMAALGAIGTTAGAILFEKLNSVVQVKGIDENGNEGTWNFGGFRIGDATRLTLLFTGIR